MEELLLVIFQFIGETLLQVVVEVLTEMGLHTMREPFQIRRNRNPLIASLGYAIFGAIAGGLSLWLFPLHLILSHSLQVVGLFASPLAASFIMVGLGAWRRRRGEELVRLDRFAYSFIFAFTMGAIRFAFAH